MNEREIALFALDCAKSMGASYADVRVIRLKTETITVKNSKVEGLTSNYEVGIGIRVLVNGSWGFAGNPDLTYKKVTKAVQRAVDIAKVSCLTSKEKVKLAPSNKVIDKWVTPFKIDPFSVSLDKKIDLLLKCSDEIKKIPKVSIAEGSMDFYKEHKWFLNTEGSDIEQEIIHSGAGISAIAITDNDVQIRSFPSSFRGQHSSGGYEIIESLNLLENAGRIGEEACALLSAKQCPSEITTLILGGSQLALQVHESCGHAVELDRVLGSEANYAGMSFITPDLLGKLQYGSKFVNIVGDSTAEFGLGTFGYDDEGVKSQSFYIVKEGRFTNYLMSRETALKIGKEFSNGTMRAQGWNNLPIIRMTNINLLPGEVSFEELIGTTEKGILLTDNRSWSIDDKRVNFQFGAEIGWEIKKGKIVGILKNPTYTGITTEFWNNCDGVANKESWHMWGTPNCGKGQPTQIMRVGHGVSYARFQNVKVGVGYDN